MKPVKIVNYTSNPFRGWVLCGIEEWPTHNAGVPKGEIGKLCEHVVFGPVFGDWREARFLVDLDPLQSVTVDLYGLEAQPYTPPNAAALDQYGRPVIVARSGTFEGRVPLEVVGWESTGVGLRAHFAGRVDALLHFDVYVDVAFGQPFAECDVVMTAANPDVPVVTWEAPADLFLEWEEESAVCMLSGFQVAQMVHQGDVIAHGKATARTGVVYWPGQDPGAKAMLSAHALSIDGVLALHVGARSPMGLPLPEMGKQALAGHAFGRAWAHKAMKALDTSDVVDLGPRATSNWTGEQEDQGYAKGGELQDSPLAILPSKYVALGLARRPCHWLEPDGRLLDRVERRKLVMWSGQPHWHAGVSPDRLGLPRLPNVHDTEGWLGPDREHWCYNRLWLALSRTARPALQRLAEHQAQLYLLQETVDPRLSTSDYSAARAVGWTCLVALNLLRLLKNKDLRDQVLGRAVARLDLYLAKLEARSLADGPRWMHTHPLPDRRAKLGAGYVRWAQTWQEGVGSGLLYMLANAREVQQASPQTADRAARMAARFAINVVEQGHDRDDRLGWKGWENVAVRADGQPLSAEEREEGVGVCYSPTWRHWGLPLAWWVAAQERHPGAREHYLRLMAEAREGAKDLAFFPPLS